VPAVAVNVVELEPAGTVTEAGIARDELLEVNPTAAPPEGASPLRIKVQVLDPAGARLDGIQASELGTMAGVAAAGGFRVSDACDTALPRVAVMVTVAAVLTLEALAVNAIEADPAATATLEGTLRLVELLRMPTVVPPLGAIPLRVTVQLEAPGVVIDEGLHATELRPGSEPTVSVPPAALAAEDTPPEEAAIGLTMPKLMVPAEMEGVIATVATTPSAMLFVLRPEARQSRLPAAAEQLSDLPAAVSEAPRLSDIEETEDEG